VTTRAIRARLTLLAHERPSIRPEEIKEATRTDQAFFDFARCHEVNLDWLGRGDIRYCSPWRNGRGSRAYTPPLTTPARLPCIAPTLP
jgi:hypothetical protein